MLLGVSCGAGYFAYRYLGQTFNIAVLLVMTLLIFPSFYLFLRTRRNVKAKRKQIDRLNGEKAVFRTRAGEYSNLDQASAFLLFVNRIERIINPEESVTRDAGRVKNDMLTNDETRISPSESKSGETILRDFEVAEAALSGDYQYDVFLSFGRQDVLRDWTRQQFLPLLLFWLQEELGRKPSVWSGQFKLGEDWDEVRRRALLSSKCLVALLTPSFFASAECRAVWATFVNRARQNKLELFELIVPAVLHENESFPAEAMSIQQIDFRDSFVLGDAFRDSAGYLTFQQKVKELSHVLATRIQRVPPFDTNFPIVTADEVDVTNPELKPKDVSLPRLS
jgi:hypothetical protein